ncbi:glycoside hydrolase family 28 protein [Pseudomonas sp. RIT-To-2]|uniref:glycoside hydrolase family 28 protein n=1 Tax=Pseudomonas sp. RIT-To-2 TaxID=3462541 RepID=UPI002412F1A2
MPHERVARAMPRPFTVRPLLAALALACSLPAWALPAPPAPRVPTLAFDDHSVILVWEKPAGHADIKDYRVYANGVLLGSSNANNDQVSPAKPHIDRFYARDAAHFHHRIALHSYTALGLKADTEYRFTVRAVGSDGQESADSPAVVQRTTRVPALFDVTRYGAKGDGTHLDTLAIQQAIDACTPGCKVLLPKGVYKSGALYLKSNMTLEIAEGATLRGSERAEDYPVAGYRQYPYSSTLRPASLINALPRDPGRHQAFENIRIVGKGTLDGNGWKQGKEGAYVASDNAHYARDGILAKAQVEQAVAGGMNVKDAYGQMRSSLITLRNVKNVFYGGFTAVNPAYHGIMNLETENVVLANTTQRTYDANNGDGIEFANSTGAMVFNNVFDTGDDCVNFAAGTGADAVHQPPQQGAWIFNNYFANGHGMVVVGSHTGAWIEGILAEDNVADGTDAGLRMKSTTFMGGGGRDVTFRDSALRDIGRQAFILTLDYNDPNAKIDYRPSAVPGQFRDVRVSDVSVENTRGMAIEVKGGSDSKSYHQGLSFERVQFSGPAGVHIDGLKDSRFEDVVFTGPRSANRWQITRTDGVSYKNIQPSP